MKKETEGLIFAAQEQALRKNWIRKNIDDQEVSEKYRMCGERDESITLNCRVQKASPERVQVRT